MQKILPGIIFLVFLIPCSYALQYTDSPYGVITNYGVLEVKVEPQKIIKDKTSPSGERRKYRFKDMNFVEKTNRIPAKKRIRFGISYEIRNLGNIKKFPYQWKITHPEMKRPDGRISTVDVYNMNLLVKNGVAAGGNAYLLKYDYEVLPGEWIFEYLYEGKVLIYKRFIVVKQEN
jgi:hypothetical protein